MVCMYERMGPSVKWSVGRSIDHVNSAIQPTTTNQPTHTSSNVLTHLRVAAEGDHLVHLLELQRDLTEACWWWICVNGFDPVGGSVRGRQKERLLALPTTHTNTHTPTILHPSPNQKRTGHKLLEALPAEVVVALAGLVARLRPRVQLLQPGLFLGRALCVLVLVSEGIGLMGEGVCVCVCVIDTTCTTS